MYHIPHSASVRIPPATSVHHSTDTDKRGFRPHRIPPWNYPPPVITGGNLCQPAILHTIYQIIVAIHIAVGVAQKAAPFNIGEIRPAQPGFLKHAVRVSDNNTACRFAGPDFHQLRNFIIIQINQLISPAILPILLLGDDRYMPVSNRRPVLPPASLRPEIQEPTEPSFQQGQNWLLQIILFPM